MTPREIILGRVREALRAKAPMPGCHEAATGQACAAPEAPTAFRQWLPAVGSAAEEQVALFARNAEMLKAEFHVLRSLADAGGKLRELAAAGQWQRLATHTNPLTDAVTAQAGVELFRTDSPYEKADLERCDAAVSACEALVAQTGTVLISSRACGGRALSVLPPHHVVVASRAQLVPDLAAAFELMHHKYEGNYPSCLSFITGPSRTGDIERILVLGAHGPKRLTILLVP